MSLIETGQFGDPRIVSEAVFRSDRAGRALDVATNAAVCVQRETQGEMDK